ncbi:MAG TPA: Flp family type IVb pilin [Candidatus Paceibacterota bacterium]
MRNLVHRFLSDKSAATAIEYALIAGGISIVIIGTVTTIGSQLNSAFYDKIDTALK